MTNRKKNYKIAAVYPIKSMIIVKISGLYHPIKNLMGVKKDDLDNTHNYHDLLNLYSPTVNNCTIHILFKYRWTVLS